MNSAALQKGREFQSGTDRRWHIALQCPGCGAGLGEMGESSLRNQSFRCGFCPFVLKNDRGIGIALRDNRRGYYEQFIRDYESVRAAEHRGSSEPEFYLALPYRDLTGTNQNQWNIRGRSFRYFVRKILPRLAGDQGLRILDLGAGNCWLSYRLALLGHSPVAVDLMTNDFDGLGAAEHYRESLGFLFPRFQAEVDRLPFQDGQFDCVIFNASFHYSENYARTLSEALRCTRPEGFVAILDTPWYSGTASGEAMLAERASSFRRQFGFASDSLRSLEYLTDDRLHQLATDCGVRWRNYAPWYGIRWAMRPWMAWIKNRREPSTFRIYVAEVSHS